MKLLFKLQNLKSSWILKPSKRTFRGHPRLLASDVYSQYESIRRGEQEIPKYFNFASDVLDKWSEIEKVDDILLCRWGTSIGNFIWNKLGIFLCQKTSCQNDFALGSYTKSHFFLLYMKVFLTFSAPYVGRKSDVSPFWLAMLFLFAYYNIRYSHHKGAGKHNNNVAC